VPVREEWIAANREEYGEAYDSLEFITDAEAVEAQSRRDELLRALAAEGRLGYSGMKVDVTNLSPGCRICAEGLWSCLFVNGICNARCSYCPAPQNDIGVAGTNLLDFPDPAEYAEYVDLLGIRGVSFSGGEPLLTAERTIGYLDAVKRRLGDRVHTWLYTNGILATPETLRTFRDHGLDEVRFDIGAVDYDLSSPAAAVGIVPTVTIEIPLVPGKRDLVASLIPKMADAGISFLNLHQLRLTPHNLKRLSGRGFRFVHGEKVTVYGSELEVLELIVSLRAAGNEFPVNYCSSAYKLAFQRRGHRLRAARLALRPGESVSDGGFIRRPGPDGSIAYVEAVLRESPTYRFPVVPVVLPGGRELAVERRPAPVERFAEGSLERIPEGLPPYR
jgi:uncharacterized protein